MQQQGKHGESDGAVALLLHSLRTGSTPSLPSLPGGTSVAAFTSIPGEPV